MKTKEMIAHLARLLVRTGERYNLAAQEWADHIQANDFNSLGGADEHHGLEGRIEAASGFSAALRTDIETVMTVEELYVLANTNPPSESRATESQIDRVRRKLRLKTDEAELLAHENETLKQQLEALGARQTAQDLGSDDPQSN